MKATKQIDIYLTQKRNVRTIDVVQYDTGIQLVFNFKDFSIPSDASATLYVQKPSGKFVLQEDGITVSGNTITIALENQAITEHGKIPYQVGITSGSDVITTFTGLIMVEKSMKDAGATESITVIRAFDEAVSVRVADFHTKAEQIVQSCIATIPADYTAMAAKVNETANAVKGYLSGAVVMVDDVSPVEHSPILRVHGKNHFNYTKMDFENRSSALVDNGNGSITVAAPIGSSAVSTKATLRQLAPTLKEGKVYTLSFNSTGTDKYIYLSESQNGWNNRTARIINEADLESTVFLYASGVNTTATISNIQIEEGAVATDYEPYIDPSTVTVTRCGKNLLPYPFNGTTYSHGITFTDNKDGSITINGVNNGEGNSVFYIAKDAYTPLPKGKYIGATSVSGVNIMAVEKGGGYITLNTSFQISENTSICSIYLQIGKGVTTTYNNVKIYPMFEVGDVVTAYEKYNGTEYIPSADGTVPGITSISPSMTILTDTEGVIVECEYNRDTNKVIDKLVNAITALCGTI